MSSRFLTHEELFASELPPYATGERRLRAMPLHIPYPCQLLVTVDPGTQEPRVTTTLLGPLSWRPYTMSASVPLSDAMTIHHLRAEGECVMAMPQYNQVRETWIMSHPLPRGICAADVARLTLIPSHRVQAPSIQECALNFECIIEYFVEYHGYGVVSLRVLGATLDDEVLPWSREEVTNNHYPLNYVGEIVDEEGMVSPRMAMMGHIKACPTFPVAHKRGWGTRMPSWLQDLADEGYLSAVERDEVMQWVERYEVLRLDPSLEERLVLQQRITTFAEYVAWQEWDSVHKYLESEGEDL